MIGPVFARRRGRAGLKNNPGCKAVVPQRGGGCIVRTGSAVAAKRLMEVLRVESARRGGLCSRVFRLKRLGKGSTRSCELDGMKEVRNLLVETFTVAGGVLKLLWLTWSLMESMSGRWNCSGITAI